MLYVGLGLIIIPFIIVVVAFIINNYKVINIEKITLLIVVMVFGVGLISYSANRSINQAELKGYLHGREIGYDDGAEEIKVTSKIYSIGYDYFEIEYCDGSIHRFAFDPEEYTEEENFGIAKTYEDYRKITSPTASQTRLNNLAEVYTDYYGFRRINDYYLCALGSYYGSIGDMFLVKLSSGRQFIVVKGDAKADEHTDSSNRYHTVDGSVVEFIVDSELLVKNGCKGDCSIFNFEGSILSIEAIGHYDF